MALEDMTQEEWARKAERANREETEKHERRASSARIGGTIVGACAGAGLVLLIVLALLMFG